MKTLIALAAGAALSSALNLSLIGPAAAQDFDLQDALRQEMRQGNIYRAYFPNAELGRKAAVSLHAQLLEAQYEQGFLVFELNAEDQARLRAFGFRLEPAKDFIARRNQRLQQLLRQPLSARDARSIPGYACYETVEETFAAAQGLSSSRPDLASWIDIGDSWLKTQGSGGHDMGVLKLTNAAVAGVGGAKPKLFIHAAMHAREYVTAPLALAFARQLVNGHGVDADATWILDHHEVHILLHTNPDGRKRAETGLSWRKNVNNNHCANSNNRGIDLNRNFGQSWNSTGGSGSSGNACDLTYRGPSASSEPETRAVEAYVRGLWPDRRGPNRGDAAPADTSGIHLDLHSFSQLVLWPWGDTSSPAPNGPALATLGRRFAWFNGYTPMQSIGLYATDGTSDAVSYGELGVAAYTFELGSSFFEGCANFEGRIRPDNLRALVYAAKVLRTPYLTPSGPDVSSLAWVTPGRVAPGSAAKLQVQVSDTRFNQSNGSEPVQAIQAVEAYVGSPPWVPGATPIALRAQDGAFDSPTESAQGSIPSAGLGTGRHLVFVRAKDASGAWGPVSALWLQVGLAAGADFSHSCAGLLCEFKGSGAEGSLARYSWDFGDGGRGGAPRVSHRYAQAGNYLVTLTTQGSNGTHSLSREIAVHNSGSVDEVEDNGSRATAQPVDYNPATVNGFMAGSTDTDYFRVQHEPGKTLSVSLAPNASSDYDLIVYDANGVELARSELGSGAVDSVAVANSGALSQTRYVRVVYYSGGTGASAGRYTLQISQ